MATDWGIYGELELAEMWFESRGASVRRSVIDDEWVLIVSVEFGGDEYEIVIHNEEVHDRADEWVYENE